MIYLMMGQIGSGKSVQSALVAEHLGAVQLGLGQLLREHYPDHPSLSTGELIDHDLVVTAVKKFLDQNGDKTVVIDGFPRNKQQQAWLDEYLATHDQHQLGKVIVLNVADELINQRLLARGRADDTPEAIAVRKHVFTSEVAPVIEAYRDQGLVTDIDGNQDVDAVNQQVEQAVKVIQ